MDAEAMTGSTPATVPLVLRGRSLVGARLVWSVLTVQAVVFFALSVPARFSQLSHPPADVRAQLAHVGLSATLYAAYLTGIACAFALVACAVAALIVWHRPHDRIGLLASLYLVFSSLASPPVVQSIVTGYPGLALPANVDSFLFVLLLVGFLFVFPDGRIVPRQARIPLLLCGLSITLAFLLTGASIVQNPPDWIGLVFAGGGIAGVAAQIYRYLWVSSPSERQQTKWVMLGVAGAMVSGIVFTFAGSLLPTVGRPGTGYDLTSASALTLAFLFIPVTVGLAILRFRLWDIDVVINRTLVYGALTAGLIGLYLLVVNGLGVLVQDRGHLPVSLLATALVAVLFAPLRQRLQSAVNRLMYGERDDPYRALTRLGERVGAVLAPEAVLPTIAETVAHTMKSPHAAITLRQTDAPTPPSSSAAFAGTPVRLPIEYQGETVGELLVAPRGPGEEFSPVDRRLLEDIARQIGPAARAVRLTADLQRSRERLVTAREEERRRLRRDLHDGLGPQMAALTLKIETIRNQFAKDRDLDAALVDLTERTQAALSDIRRLVYALRPPALDELGLVAAIGQAAEQYGQQGGNGLHVTVDTRDSLPPLPAAVEVAAYRLVQEALANVVRHSGARTCRLFISLDKVRDVLRLEIVDDGRGLPVPHHAGVGLVSMRERAEELGGCCNIVSPPSGGTIVTADLPCPSTQQQPVTVSKGGEGSLGNDTHPHSR